MGGRGKREHPVLAVFCQLGHQRGWADGLAEPGLPTWPLVLSLVFVPPRPPERMKTGPGVAEPGAGLGREMPEGGGISHCFARA